MRAPAKAKATGKGGRARPSRSNARPGSSGTPSWAVTTPEDEKELNDTIRRVLDGSEKLTRILV